MCAESYSTLQTRKKAATCTARWRHKIIICTRGYVGVRAGEWGVGAAVQGGGGGGGHPRADEKSSHKANTSD